MNKNILALMPVFVFMIIMLIVSIYVRRASAKKASEGFVKDYFIGSRSLGGFVLAMTTVATYSSVSSFVGGPGQAWSIRMDLYVRRSGDSVIVGAWYPW